MKKLHAYFGEKFEFAKKWGFLGEVLKWVTITVGYQGMSRLTRCGIPSQKSRPTKRGFLQFWPPQNFFFDSKFFTRISRETPHPSQKSIGSRLLQGPQYGDFVLGRYTRLFFECEMGWVGPLFGKVCRHTYANDLNGYANEREGIPAFLNDLPGKVGRRKKSVKVSPPFTSPVDLKNKKLHSLLCEGRQTNKSVKVGWPSHFSGVTYTGGKVCWQKMGR